MFGPMYFAIQTTVLGVLLLGVPGWIVLDTLRRRRNSVMAWLSPISRALLVVGLAPLSTFGAVLLGAGIQGILASI